MAAIQLGKILLPSTPKTSTNPEEQKRNIDEWARAVERTFRQLETAFNALSAKVG